jgi:hypothetical protein
MGLMGPDGLSGFFSLCTGLVKDFLYNPSAPIRPVRSDPSVRADEGKSLPGGREIPNDE